MEKEPDAECSSSASYMSTGKSKLDTLAKDDLIKFAKKQMAAMQKLKSKCAGLEEKVEALKANPGGTSDDSVIQELTERMDAVLLEKAETQQMLVLLRKENETLKNQREESVEKVAALQEKLHHAEMDHTEKIKHLEEQFKISETKYREELQAFKKLASENEEIQRHRLQEDFNANIEAVRQEYERKISDLEQNLELTKKELKTENEGLQETHHVTLQIKQGEIENLQETISKLSKQHEDEVSYLEEQLEISATDFDMERERLLLVQEELSEQIALKESYLQDVQEEEEDLNRRTQKPSESMEALDSPDPENEMDRLRLAVQDLQSQNTMLKEELTFLTNVKAALEGDLKHLKEEYSMEREELEFKINELQMTKEEGEICPEKEPEDVTTAKETIRLEEHNQILQGLKESHKTEMKELEANLASSNEREKEVIAQEAQDLQNKCKVLSEEKNAVVDEYEHTKEILRNIELELGDRTSEFVKKYNAMKEQAAVSVQELEEKLREKDGLIEKLECTQKEVQESSEQKPQREENIAPEDKDVHMVMMSDTENLVTLKDIVIYMEKIQEECKHAGVDTARVTLEKLKDLSGALQGALDETKCLRSSEAELESRLSHEKEQLAKDLALSNEEKAELQREHQSASHERDALRKDLEISEEKLSEARKQVCNVLAQNYSVEVHEDKDISTLLEQLLSRVQEEKSTCIVLDEEKAKLEKDLGALSEERHDLKKVLEDSDRKLSETQKRVCEILEQHFSVNMVGEEDITVLLNHLLSSIHEEKKSYNEEKMKLQGDLVTVDEEKDHLKRCVETHERNLSDARKRVCEVLEQNYSVNMDEAEDISVLLDHLLSRGQEEKSTCMVSNEEKAKLEKDLKALSEERNDLKKVLEDSERELSDARKRVCEILEQNYSVNMDEQQDLSVLLEHLLSRGQEDKSTCIVSNEEKLRKLENDLQALCEERNDLKKVLEDSERELSDTQKHVCEILEQHYAVNMVGEENVSVLLNHLLSSIREEKKSYNEEKMKLQGDLVTVDEEKDHLKRCVETHERNLSDARKRVCEVLEQNYSVNMDEQQDLSVLLDHLLSRGQEEKSTCIVSNEDKAKLEKDLQSLSEERNDLKKVLEDSERELSDTRKRVCEILEQNYSVNMDEQQDLSVLLDHLLSRGQEDKSTCIVSNEEKLRKLENDLQSLSVERNDLKKVLEDGGIKLSETQKRVCEILEQHFSVNTVGEEDITVLLNHLLSSIHEEKKSYMMLNEEKNKLQGDLVNMVEERDELRRCVETHEGKLSDAQKRVCEILEQNYSVIMDEAEDISVLLDHLLSRGQEEKSTCIVSNEEKAKLEKDLQALSEERNDLKKVLEESERELSDTRKRVCEILEQNYSVNMDEQQDLSVLLEHLLSRGQEDKSTCIVSNEEKLRKLENDLQALCEERNDLKKVLEDNGTKLSETQKRVCEILEQHFSVNTVGEEDITVLLNHLLSSIHEEKKSYMMLNEEKMKLQGDLVTVDEEKDHLKRCVETHERNLSDARKRVCEVLEQNYSVNMDEQQDLSVLLDHFLSRGQEEKSTCIVSIEEKAKLQKDLQSLSEERNDLKKVFEDGERKLSDAQKHVCEIMEQHYAVNTVGEEDVSVLLNHLLSSIREEKKSYNEEKMKLQGDLVTHERNLSDARKSVCEILEQNYSVNMEEEQDLSVLLDHLLSRVQEEKLVLTQQLDGKAVQHEQAELIDAGFLQTTGRNEVLPDTVNLQGDQNQQVEISGRLASQEREEPAVEGGTQETDDMKSLQQKLSEKESIVAHLKEELSLLQESKLSTLNENVRQIEFLEKESKEKEERLNKFKAVAVKARKELDSSRKEASRLKEELEALRAEKDKMSDSMKAIIHGAESYKNLMIDYDKQTELLDSEKEKLEASEKLIVDLNKRLHVAVEQHQQLSSEREDLMAHIETLQSNVRQLESQALEMHKLKSTVERDLEAERLLKEQKTKEHVCAVKEVEELHSFLQKQKQHLQQTEQELEQLRKDAQQSTLLDMEMADYERLVKELNLQLSEKDRLLEEQERQTQAQREREENLNQEIESLKSLVDAGEEKTAKVKQLLVKAKKDLADAKKEEASQMIVQSSLKGELESIQQQLENYKIESSELTADRHRLQEQLKALNDQHQKSVTSSQTQVTTLQNDLSTTKADLESIKSEYNSYKVRVHNVLKQQKNKSSTQSDGDFSKQERENMETMVEQLRSKLQESQLNAQSCNAELQQLQTEYDTLLERHNKMLQQTIAKEAELRERLLSLHTENVALKSEHSQSVAQLTAQTETLRSSFREQLHHLQDEHRSTVETLQHQINSLESQLFQLQKESATSAAQQPSKKLQSDRKLVDLPLFEMNMAREEGEGMETTESESLSTAGTPPPSLEQLLASPDPKHEPFVWQVEPTKEELTNKLSTATRSMEHMNSLLHESEATNAILMEQISLLKSEMRRLERNQEREKSVANLEYLKNVLLQFIFLRAGSEKQALLPVIHTMLQLSPEEKSKLSAIAHGEEEAAASRGSGWTSYLHSWSGIR